MSNNNQKIYYAFFDLDETLISTKSMFSFLKFYCKQYAGIHRYFMQIYKLKLLSYFGKSREYVNFQYYKFFEGVEANFLKKICRDWFQNEMQSNSNFFNSNIVYLLNKHKENGGIPVLVSGSFIECIKPIAEFCQIEYVLATHLEKDGYGKYTGKILPPQTIGKGKLTAIQNFLDQRSYYDYKYCYAYGDHLSDGSMLNFVGNPYAVISSHNKLFAKYAQQQGWRIIQAT